MTPEEKHQMNIERAVALAGGVGGAALGAVMAPAAAAASLPVRLAASVLTGAGTGELTGATRASMEGKGGMDVLDASSEEGLLGGLVGGGIHAGGELAAGGAKLLRAGKGWLSTFLRGKDVGAYEDPAMASLPKGPEGIQESAEAGHNRVVKRYTAIEDKRNADYGLATHGTEYVPPEPGAPPPKPEARRLGASVRQKLLEAVHGPDATYEVTPGGRVRPTNPADEASVPREGPGASVDQRALPPPRGPLRPGGRLDLATAPTPPGSGEPLIPQSTALQPTPGRLNRPGSMFDSGEELGAPRPFTPLVDPPYEPPAAVGAEPPPTYEGTARQGVDYTRPSAPRSAPRPDLSPGKAPVDRGGIMADLESARKGNVNPDTGYTVNSHVEKELANAIDALGPEGTENTVEGMLKLRRSLQARANFPNLSPTREEMAARDVYQTFRAAIRKASPTIAEADDAFAASMRGTNRTKDILYGSEDPTVKPTPEAEAEAADLRGETAEPQMRVGKEDAGITRMKRIGDTNEPGLRARSRLEELGNQDAEYQAALAFVKNKKALEAVRPGVPHLPTSLHEAFMWPVRFGQQNARAGAAHLLDPALRAGSNLRLTPPISGMVGNPLFDAYEATKERRKRQAETVRNGGHH